MRYFSFAAVALMSFFVFALTSSDVFSSKAERAASGIGFDTDTSTADVKADHIARQANVSQWSGNYGSWKSGKWSLSARQAPQEETVTVTVTSIPDYCQTLESVLESSATPIAPVPVTAFTPLPLGPEMSTSAPAEASTSSALSLPVSEVSSLGGSTTSNDISVAQVPPTSAGSSTTTDVVSTSSMTEMTTAQTLSTSQSVGVTPTAPPARNDADGGNHALAAVMSTLVALVSAGFVSWMLV